MGSLLKLYRTINILSLDVAFGAVCSAMFFARLLHVAVLPYGLAALGLTVWIIYTADHLRDARAINNQASSYRHLFHQQYFKILVAFLIVAIIIDVIVIIFIRRPVFFSGLSLTAVVACYLIFQRKLSYLKEFFVAFLYTAGVLLPSVTVTTDEINLFQWELMSQFFLIALLNLLIFSWFDADRDQRDSLSSFVTRFGKHSTRTLIRILFLLIVVLSFFQFFSGEQLIALTTMLFMTLILLIIFSYPRIFEKNETYRLVGDAIFFLPILFSL
jgi:4-hydroxybenzoate polyprenyltransferase